jgi:hypothetical protein
MGKRPKRARSERRERERKADKLVRQRERLEATEAGASAERPIEVESTSQIDGVARSLRCPRCDLGLFIAYERASVVGARVCRAVETECRQCGRRRTVHFAVGAALH